MCLVIDLATYKKMFRRSKTSSLKRTILKIVLKGPNTVLYIVLTNKKTVQNFLDTETVKLENIFVSKYEHVKNLFRKKAILIFQFGDLTK